MVCIAAFIILILVGVFVAIISIFKPEVGRAYRRNLKRAAQCFGKKVRLQKCETGFKEDVKNSLLSRIVVKHPTWVKPLSFLIEFLSVVFVLIVLWALITAIKSLLALWALGTCNVSTPASCSLSSESCSIDEDGGNWFSEWGEIFEAIPEKFRTYNPDDYDFSGISVSENSESRENSEEEKPRALDIVDPGCIVCARSFKNQTAAGFFDDYDVTIVPYAIHTSAGPKFKNSDLIVRYLLSAEAEKPGSAYPVLKHIFIDESESGETYQSLFDNAYSEDQAASQLETWLKENLSDEEISRARANLYSEEIENEISENDNLILNTLNLKGIPTFIYDGSKHTGLWKADE